MAFISPDCDKPLPHGGCTGTAFDHVADEVVACECPCHPILTPPAPEDSDAVAGSDVQVGARVRLYSPGIAIRAVMGYEPFVFVSLERDYAARSAVYAIHAGGGLPLEPSQTDPTRPYETGAVIAFLEATLEMLRAVEEQEGGMETRSFDELQREIAGEPEDMDAPDPNDVLPDALFAPESPSATEQHDAFPKSL